MKKNKIAVIGATGKAGKYLLKELMQHDFQLKLLVRNPEKIQTQNSSVQVIQGNVNSYDDVKTLLDDCDVVISMLGLGVPNSEKNIFSTSTQNILKAMEEFKINRYLVITGLNVDTPFDQKGPKTKMGTDWMKANFPETTADKQKEYEILSESNVDWTLVRLPLIEQTDEKYDVDANLEDCLGDKISATNLALFLIEQLESKSYSKKAPFLSNI
ncbi:SDR family oxidoreductase [Flavobacterium sp.]|uniref:NAD(P)-dependent oxidoreductase n=1 Tax=Flavobacterium sp. TaxID=239 RepID=UPI002BF79207|nr:SDR family oxidoreductase [Flavobacterium sp.]HSD06464.1 SDR family oxidoreductase [Flavobacterium sp.]